MGERGERDRIESSHDVHVKVTGDEGLKLLTNLFHFDEQFFLCRIGLGIWIRRRYRKRKGQ